MNVVFTNNPVVAKRYPDIVRYFDKDVQYIFTAVRDEIHKGATLVSHPLSGSVKPYQSPYKSVAVSLSIGSVDLKSLQIIEDALGVLRKFEFAKRRDFNESILDDYMTIDLDLITNAV